MPFQISEIEERPTIRWSEDSTKVSAATRSTRVGATPRFVLISIGTPPTFALGVAQRSTTSNGGPSAEIEPESATQHVPKFRPVEMVLRVPSMDQQATGFQKLQEYEGEVLSIGTSDFVARLVDLTDAGGPRLEATFSIDVDVSPSDKPLLREGAVFYWVIGFKDYSNGQRKTEQFLRFRRLPIWSRRDLERLDTQVKELKAFLQSDG